MTEVDRIKVLAMEALKMWLKEQAAACNDLLATLDPSALEWARTTQNQRGYACYMMGSADAMEGALKAVSLGLRMYIDQSSGELIGVDVAGDPMPLGVEIAEVEGL